MKVYYKKTNITKKHAMNHQCLLYYYLNATMNHLPCDAVEKNFCFLINFFLGFRFKFNIHVYIYKNMKIPIFLFILNQIF